MERNTQNRIMLLLSKAGTKIFRNNTAMGWAGPSHRQPNGDVIVRNGYPIRAGLCEGSSDLIGWTPVTITPEMVGRRVAIFTAVEVKTPTGRPTHEQLNFIARLKADGGYAGIARSEEEAIQIIK
jgi:hypothetical protein